ncbi:MAG: GAF domain-containing protein [Anaerolineales bacterium]|nr:GAF domain-containing protein [Anaerolineales bacterium]
MEIKPPQGKPITEEDRTRLELLYHVSREVAAALDLRTVLQRVLFEAIQNVGGERGSIVVLDDNGKAVDSTIVFGERIQQDTTQQLRDTVEHGLAGWVLKNRKPALISDTSLDERWLQRPDDAKKKTGAKSALCMPLLARDQLVGVLTLVHSQPNAFGTEHLDLMQAIADQAGIAVLNARLYTESQQKARVMSALAESAAAINTSLRLDEVLQRILNQTIQALQVETVALALTEPASGELVFQAATGHNAGNILNRHIPSGQGLASVVIKNGRGVVISDVSKDQRFKNVDRFGGIETRAVAMAPIQAPGKVIGVLEAINPVAGEFDIDALLVLTGLGSLAGTSIQNAQIFERMDSSHQHYRELFEDSIDPILLTDWDGKIIEANRQALEFSGYNNKNVHNVTIDKLHDVNWNMTGLGFDNLKSYQTFSYDSVLRNVSGRAIPIQVNVRPVEFENAILLQWIFHDISERKALDDLRNDLMSMVYHDLRAPLANVISSLDLLSGLINDEDDEDVQSILKVAFHSTTRIERMINTLLDINRLESGQEIVTRRAIDISGLVVDAVNEVEQVAESRNQKIHIQLPETEKLAPVWIDGEMILRVLINLLENAAKFSPPEGQITINAQAENAWVKVFVKDHGPAIPVSEQERIFNKFIRLHGKDKRSGLGIGLAFCRLAVEGHGGRIWVESESDKGNTFSFTLPVASEEQRVRTSGD